jgi:DNA-binding MarR family transcriptional regulator
MPDVIDSLEHLMYEAVGMTAVALATAAAGELTLSQWRILVVVGRLDAIRVGDIAAAVGTSLTSTSRLVQRLERRGLVTTARDEADRRATLVRISDRGLALRERVVACRRELMEAALREGAPNLPKGLAAGLRVIADAFRRYA